ncbi:immunoglobulin superfamily member 6 isoform X1 [Chiroxiphia lanceolata]|uniref:immunoglobulin superfamily member 6 isoform X1 n=1 Tax=Chiroxiphia lanceolata TaxID=296741 RepID=UPI0013CE6ED8|nr:immunoglobulin superfamily member 6 isoform X1 [Chiroxiphia lanceolata]
MATFNKLKNVLVLAFDWILYGAGVKDNCQVIVTQPRFQEADSSMSSVVLTCAFSASGCSPSPPEVLWFRFLTHTHQDLCTPGCKDHQKYKVHLSESNTSLEIQDLTVEDSGVYICGIAFSDSDSPRSKQTGDGTVLMKTGEQHSNGKLAFTFLIIISSLLFVYSSTVFTFFVVYKLKPKLLKKSGKDQRTENCKINSGRKVFQAIAQELQKQGFAEHCQQPDDLEADTVYQNR